MKDDRVIAIGDIHGHKLALLGLLRCIEPMPGDTLVFLGDYIDRGPDSAGVIQTILELAPKCHVVTLQGNHERMLLDAERDPRSLSFWLSNGGDAVLRNYAGSLDNVPLPHREFLESLVRSYEIDRFFFVHANYLPDRPIEDLDSRTALWTGLDDFPKAHCSGKIAVVGHSPQMDGKILDAGYLIGIDTGCGFGGRLTALDVIHGDIWQVTEMGEPIGCSSSPD